MTTTPQFPTSPGARVRHLQRIYNNPLFEQLAPKLFQQRLEGAIYMDQQEQENFELSLHALISEIADLDSNVQSDVILKLKEKLDQAYEQSAALGGDQNIHKRTIIQMVNVLMQAVWQGAQGDPQAEQNLREEESARKQHYDLLECSLIADVLNPHSIIQKDDLVPVILSESLENLKMLFFIFDNEQQVYLQTQARLFLENQDPQKTLSLAWNNLAWIKEQ